MFGAAFGDVVGSPYEFDRGSKSKAFMAEAFYGMPAAYVAWLKSKLPYELIEVLQRVRFYDCTENRTASCCIMVLDSRKCY